MKSFFTHHYMALVLAILIGAVCVAPSLYFTLHATGYAGIVMMGTDGEEHYLARMNQVYGGHPGVGNVFLPNKNVPYFAPAGGEIVALSPGMPLGLSPAQTEILGKFFFPFLITLVFYALGYVLSGSRVTGLIIAATVLLGLNLTDGPSAWISLMRGQAASSNFIAFDRPVNPEVSGALLGAGLLLIYRIFFLRRTHLWESVALALILASLLYISLYIYTFFGMCILLCLVWLLYRHEWKEAWHALAIGTVGLIGSIPFLLNYRALTATAAYAASAARQGVITGHAPVVGLWIPIILFLAIFAWPKPYMRAKPFFIIIGLAILILSNQQILTGYVLQVNHYHWYITKPLIGIVFVLYAAYGLERLVPNRGIHLTVWSLGLIILFYNACLIQAASYRAFYADTLSAQAYAPVLADIRALPPKQVVMADPALSIYISIYTQADAPNNAYAIYYLVPQSYLEERLFLNYKLRGITPTEALATMQTERADISGNLYGIYWRDKTGSMSGIPDTILQKLSEEYAAYYLHTVPQMMQDLGMTLLIKDTSNSTWATSTLSDLTHTNTISNRFVIYTLNPGTTSVKK